MRGNYHPTTVYLDEELRRQVTLLALTLRKPKAKVMRDLMLEGLKHQQTGQSRSARALLDLAGIIPKESGLPKDLSEKHNEYTWDK